MGFLDAFIERDDKPKKAKPTPTPSTPTSVEKITIGSQPTMVTTGGYASSELVQQFLDKFRQVLADENTRNFPGNDYYEFFQMKEAMTAPMPEDVKYQAVFAGWRASGKQTKDTLVSTAKSYLNLLERDISDVENALKTQYDQTVGKSANTIAQKQAEVQKLAAQIATLNNEIQDLKKSNVDQESSIAAQRDAFAIASKQIREEIQGEIEKINKYIQ